MASINAEIPISARILAQAGKAYRLAKNAQKGLRWSYIEMISIIGKCEGLRNTDYSRIFEVEVVSMHNRLERLQIAGHLVKIRKRYYLTDSGRAAYNAVNNSLTASFAQIEAEMLERVRAQLINERII